MDRRLLRGGKKMKARQTKSNKKYLIILLIVFLLALAIGYAAFTDTLNISGTANANGTFDLEFQNANVDSAVGCDATETKATISADKNTLTVAVKDLAYPGAGAQISVDIVNVGSIPAKVKSVTPTNITGSDNIKISGLDAITTDHPTIAANGKCSLTFTVEWDADSTAELTADEKSGISFDLEIEYTQDTTDVFNGNSAHTDA
jgi:phage tail sheath gpL-like